MRNIVEMLRGIEAEQKRRREEDRLAAYNSGEKKHEKQLAFHKCTKRNRWVFGGNRSGKTECGAVECVYMARGTHPYRENRKDVQGVGGFPVYAGTARRGAEENFTLSAQRLD